jgi:uncharacterized protein YggE
MGNYQTQQKQYTNINYTAQYRAVPKAASFLGNNMIEISINALSNQRASSYTAIFSVMQFGKTAEETNSILDSRLTPFISQLKGLGIPDSNIYVDMVNFLPKYEFDVSKKIFSKKTYTEVPTGFELQKNVHIRYSDPGLLDKIVAAAARQEIYDIVKVDYFVSDPSVFYRQLRSEVFEYANQIKAEYKKIGLELDSAYLQTAENAWVAYPINRYESYQAFTSSKPNPLDKSSAIWNMADKPEARFYNAVPANDYDIVINPEILEPAVQFSYNLVLRFTMPERQPRTITKNQKEFIWITPEGEVKPLKIE